MELLIDFDLVENNQSVKKVLLDKQEYNFRKFMFHYV